MSQLDVLVDELVEVDPSDWERSDDDWHLRLEKTRISLCYSDRQGDLELYVSDYLVRLNPDQRMRLYKRCHDFRAWEQNKRVAAALEDLQRRKRET